MKIKSNAIGCPICNSNEYKTIFKGSARWGYEITNVVCKDCGLVYQNPSPTGKALDEYYENKYHKISGQHPERITEDYLRNFSKRRATYIGQVFGKYTDLAKDANILEVGFGIGAVIYQLSKDGYTRLTGMDSSITHENITLLENIWELKNHKIFKAKFEIFLQGWKKLNGDRFSLVILHHVLEHVPYPILALSSCITVLQPNSYIFVATPDIFWPRGGWNKFFVMPHLACYCNQTLNYLWDMLGFEVVASGYWHKAGWNLLRIGRVKTGVEFDKTLAERVERWIANNDGTKRNRAMIPDTALNYPL